jgi:hypothetical protein
LCQLCAQALHFEFVSAPRTREKSSLIVDRFQFNQVCSAERKRCEFHSITSLPKARIASSQTEDTTALASIKAPRRAIQLVNASITAAGSNNAPSMNARSVLGLNGSNPIRKRVKMLLRREIMLIALSTQPYGSCSGEAKCH